MKPRASCLGGYVGEMDGLFQMTIFDWSRKI